MWTIIAIVVWIVGSGVCSIFVDFVWKISDDFDILEVAALVSLWPLFVVTIIAMAIGISLYGWWCLTKRMFGVTKKICISFDPDRDS
jgi:hypothetical protein|tara:strand:+ start:1008 stop:1268 length:261 start_codon:yes stop_codon:yes gene_type:complete